MAEKTNGGARMHRAEGAPANILVVDDEATVVNLLAHALRLEGYEVRTATSAAEASLACRDWQPDVALVDIHLGHGTDGFALTSSLGEGGRVAVIIVSGSIEAEDIKTGFAAGADMYVEKPFDVEKLLARVSGLLAKSIPSTPHMIKVADLTVDLDAHLVTRGGNTIHLAPREFELLCALIRRPGRAMTKAQLLSEVWGYAGYGNNVVERSISSLRGKLEVFGPRLVHTIHGIGYTIREHPAR